MRCHYGSDPREEMTMVADHQTKRVVTMFPFLRAWATLSAVALGLLSTQDVQATDRFFHDISVKSPNGRYLVEAKSPDNAGGRWKKSFQSRFTYRLMDQIDGRELWSRQQPMTGNTRFKIAEGPPDKIKDNPDVIKAYLGEEHD